MAAASPAARALQEELFCPICLDYFTEPVVLNCEHNFCRACISMYWDSLEGSFLCPQCRTKCHGGEFRPNVQLGRVAERAKELAWATAHPARDSPGSACSASRKPEKAREEKCQLHHEALKLFCKEDQALICVVCDRSKEHRQHTVIPVEEAAEEYKTQLHHHLTMLKSERGRREILAIDHGKKLEMLMTLAEAEKQRTAHAFQQLREILQNRENQILQGLSEVIKDLKQMQQGNSNVQQGATLLQALILELEQKCQQPDMVFLKDAGSLLNRCKGWKFQKWTPMSTTRLEEQISDFSQKKKFLWEHMTEMQEILTLDRESAHCGLTISADRKTVSRKAFWTPFNISQQFDPSFCVLGTEGFTSGRHHWLVEVRGLSGWALGVARESVDRKKPVVLHPDYGIWAVELGRCLLFPASPAPKETMELSNRRIRVSLDYDAGWLTFSDSGNPEPLFTFRTSFTEKLYPFFWLWSPEASLTLCS